MKDSTIFGLEYIFFILVFLKKPWQSIYSYIFLALAIINLKIVLRKLLSLTDLLRAQTLWIHETTKVIVVHKNENLIFVIFQVVAPSFEYFNNS